MSNFYEPDNDSFLLLDESMKFLDGKENLDVLEVGVGSGYVVTNLETEFSKNNYFGTDINDNAIKETLRKSKNIEVKKGNLIEPFDKEFDLIIFNTPYLPMEDGDDWNKLSDLDKAIYGGKKGYEVIEEFIYQLNDKLKNSGYSIIVFSSLSNYEHIKEVLDKNFFVYELLEEKSEFFEKLYCIKIYKSSILKKLSKLKLNKLKYLASGKHSNNLSGYYKNTKIIVKIGKEQHLQKEFMFLDKLQNEGFAPKLFFHDKNFVVREMFEGTLIVDFFVNSNYDYLIKVLEEILIICSRLDELGINKFEMTNPYKHIYVMDDLSVKFIDFERCIYTDKPKNVTQVLEFFKRYGEVLSKKGINLNEEKILMYSKEHKKKGLKITLDKIIS